MRILDSFSLKGRTIAVLGGEGLLGRVAVETIRELGGTAVSIDIKTGCNYVCDLAHDFGRLVEIVGYHSYSGVVNCAIGNQRPVTSPSTGFFDDIQIGLVAAANAHKAFFPVLKDNNSVSLSNSVFLNVGSDLSLKAPSPKRYGDRFKPLSYSVIKFGIVGMTKYYAALWGKYGIRVNCLCPGSIDQGQAVPDCALGRLAQPQEMAGAIAWLMSDASSYVTGAIISVDGGSTL